MLGFPWLPYFENDQVWAFKRSLKPMGLLIHKLVSSYWCCSLVSNPTGKWPTKYNFFVYKIDLKFVKMVMH